MKIVTDEGITKKELDTIRLREELRYTLNGMELGELILTLSEDEEEIIVHSAPKTKIMRVRRITGYLSNQNNFNDAKKAELRDRVAHFDDKSKELAYAMARDIMRGDYGCEK